MSRYLIFHGKDHDEGGGIYDFWGDVDGLDAAIEKAKEIVGEFELVESSGRQGKYYPFDWAQVANPEVTEVFVVRRSFETEEIEVENESGRLLFPGRGCGA